MRRSRSAEVPVSVGAPNRPPRVALAVGTVVMLSALVAACGGQTTSAVKKNVAPVALTMAEDPGVTALPQYVAEAQGFFTAHHLKVTIKPVLNIDTIPAGLLAGQFQFGMTAQPILLTGAQHGLDLVVTAGQAFDTPAAPIEGVMVGGGSPITSPTGLVGKVVGLPALTGNIEECFVSWLQHGGVVPSSVHMVQVAFPNMAAQLSAHRIDAAVVIQPFEAAIAGQGGRSLADPCMSVDPSGTGFSLQISARAWAQKHRDVVVAVEESLDEADAFILAHPAQAKSVLARFTSVSPQLVGSLTLPVYKEYESASDLQRWVSVMRSQGLLGSAPVSTAKLLDEPVRH